MTSKFPLFGPGLPPLRASHCTDSYETWMQSDAGSLKMKLSPGSSLHQTGGWPANIFLVEGRCLSLATPNPCLSPLQTQRVGTVLWVLRWTLASILHPSLAITWLVVMITFHFMSHDAAVCWAFIKAVDQASSCPHRKQGTRGVKSR